MKHIAKINIENNLAKSLKNLVILCGSNKSSKQKNKQKLKQNKNKKTSSFLI